MIGFICITHKSENCRGRNTFDPINNFIDSLYKHCNHSFILYIFDNGSDEKYEPPKYRDAHPFILSRHIVYTYIEDQTIGGLALPYNMGVQMAYKDNCDIICLVNDDLILNDTINTFFDIIENHPHKNVGIYGALSDGVPRSKIYQRADGPGKGIKEITNYKDGQLGNLNGFMFAFSREVYRKWHLPDGTMFDKKYLWGGGEGALKRRIKPLGARFFVINECWVQHIKIGGWRGYKNAFPGRNESRNKTKNNIRRKRVAKKRNPS